MHIGTFALIIMGFVAGSQQRKPDSARCSQSEVPAPRGRPQRDGFCIPNGVPVSELFKLRRCICKRGFLRDRSGQCIPKQDCYRCGSDPYMVFNPCASACRGKGCESSYGSVCPELCVPRCECIKGYVPDPLRQYGCIPESWCPLRCPRFSSWQRCHNTCSRSCGGSFNPRFCERVCDKGKCVCHPGFAETYIRGVKVCVPQHLCPRTRPE